MTVTNGTTALVSGRDANQKPLHSHFIGGNNLDVATPSAVKDFVAQHDGHSVITSVSLRLLVPEERAWNCC